MARAKFMARRNDVTLKSYPTKILCFYLFHANLCVVNYRLDEAHMKNFFSLEGITTLYNNHQLLMILCIMLLIFYPLLFISKSLSRRAVHKFFSKIEAKYVKIFRNYNLKSYFTHTYIAIYLLFCISLLLQNNIWPEDISEDLLKIAISIYATLVFTSLFLLTLDISSAIYNTKSISKRVPISLHANILKIIIMICSALTIISYILHISIPALFASLGAAAALITFIFKDAALGLVAGLQLTLMDLIRIGDWITVTSYNADGIIEKITITTVVVRNNDKTISTIPTSNLMSTGFKNWRYMSESGGRRIQRSFNIDLDSIKSLDQKSLDRLKKLPFFSGLAQSNPELFDLNPKVTNLELFRNYVNSYLKQHPMLHQENFVLMTRHLEPKPDLGVPLEIYAYSKNTDLIPYEKIQSEITEYVIASLAEFDL